MKKGNVLGLIALSAILLTGCVDAMPELTAEQSDIIAEYAAGLILKYSPRYQYRIVSEEELAAAVAERQQDVSEPEPEPATEPEQTQVSAENTPDAPSENVSTEQESQPAQILSAEDVDFAAELGIDDLIIRYQSFEVCSSYPQDSIGYGVDAAKDKKLLILHFDLEGLPEEDVNCNLFDCNLKLRVTVNDTISASALNTVLSNNLITYIDVVKAGETVDVVAVAEINDMAEADIQSMVLRASANGNNCTAKLK